MLRLNPTITLKAVLAGAVATVQPGAVVSYSDKTAATFSGDTQMAALNGATPVVLCAAPATDTERLIDFVSLHNADTAAIVATIYYDGVTRTDLMAVTLEAGEALTYTHAGGWRVLTPSGSEKGSGGSTSLGFTPEDVAHKDQTDGYAGLSGLALRLKNAAGTITSLLSSVATVSRTWVFPDKNGTVAMTSDVLTDHTQLTNIGANSHAQIDTALARLANTSGANTGDQDLSGKQNLLVAGTNIKTVNGGSLLGAGDLSVSAAPGGSSGQLQMNSTGAFAGVSGSSVSSNGSLTLGGSTVAANDPALNLSQTFNNAAVIFSGLKIAATVTAADPRTKLVDVQQGGANAFAVRASGWIDLAAGVNTAGVPTVAGVQGNPGANGGIAFTANGLPQGWFSGTDWRIYSAGMFTWSGDSTTAVAGRDTGLARNAAGVVEVNSGTAGTFRDLKLRTLQPQVFTVATLPSASTMGSGARTHVSDASAPAFGSTVAGGGAVSTPVYSDGTNWKVG